MQKLCIFFKRLSFLFLRFSHENVLKSETLLIPTEADKLCQRKSSPDIAEQIFYSFKQETLRHQLVVSPADVKGHRMVS